jgi:hypothetical protein
MHTKIFDGMSDALILLELDKLSEEERFEIICLMKRNPNKHLSVLRILDKNYIEIKLDRPVWGFLLRAFSYVTKHYHEMLTIDKNILAMEVEQVQNIVEMVQSAFDQEQDQETAILKMNSSEWADYTQLMSATLYFLPSHIKSDMGNKLNSFNIQHLSWEKSEGGIRTYKIFPYHIWDYLGKAYKEAQSSGVCFVIHGIETGNYSWGDIDLNFVESLDITGVQKRIEELGFIEPNGHYQKYIIGIIDARNEEQGFCEESYIMAKDWKTNLGYMFEIVGEGNPKQLKMSWNVLDMAIRIAKYLYDNFDASDIYEIHMTTQEQFAGFLNALQKSQDARSPEATTVLLSLDREQYGILEIAFLSARHYFDDVEEFEEEFNDIWVVGDIIFANSDWKQIN